MSHPSAAGFSPLIRIDHLSYGYPPTPSDSEQVWVLDGVNLEIAAGEFVAIMGPTGGGKTTLCLTLNGIVPHSTGGIIGGNVVIDGLNTKRHPVAILAQRVGLVFQEPETQLFNMTVETELAFGLENLGLPPAEMRERITWALSLVGMQEYRQRAPSQLSGGQQQRVAIAALLAMRPKILVLDEPTAYLDSMGKRDVFSAVQTLRQQHEMTVILVSHESEQIAEFSDRLVILNEGKVVIDEAPSVVFAQFERMRHIGLSVPQVSELAHCLNRKQGTNYSFARLDEAVQALTAPAERLRRRAVAPCRARPVSRPPKSTPAIDISDLWFAYEATPAALRGVSLTVGTGERVALIGRNGAGKTTLAKHLNGLLRPSRGDIRLFGENVNGRSVGELARTVGYVFQNPDHQIFSPSVREELAAGPRNLGIDEPEVEQRVDEALARFGLLPYADRQPALLSFGLRRAVSVAAVVTMETAILVLDEPTSGLDWRSACELMAMLEELAAKGRTVLIITHDMRLVAERILRCLVMSDGQIIADAATRHIFQQTDSLRKARIEPPQIAELAKRLKVPGDILTVTDFCEQL